MSNVLLLSITGMHCPACSILVEKEILSIPGITRVSVHLSDGTAEISWEGDSPPSLSEINGKLGKFGYAARVTEAGSGGDPLGAPETVKRQYHFEEWIVPAMAAIALAGLFFLFQSSGIMNSAASLPAAGAAAALLVGVAASFSSCLALVGSYILALNTLWAESGKKENLKLNLKFQGGRVLGFAIFGGALGALGGSFLFSYTLYAVFITTLALILFLFGLIILGVRLPGKGIRLPRGVSKTMEKLSGSGNPAAPVLIGGLTFFIPCGFTLSVQAFALASGSLIRGAVIMGAFALGTLPVLFAVGLAGSWTKKKGKLLSRASGFLILIFSFHTLASGIGMFGFGIPGISGTSSVIPESQTQTTALAVPPPPNPEGVQRIETRVMPYAFEPAELRVKAGIPVEWAISGIQVSGCTNRIIIPGTDISIPVVQGEQSIIRFTPGEPGIIRYMCWMGMVAARIIIE